MREIMILILSAIIISGLTAAVINVPADQATIQGGIIAATLGDTVLVQPGHYYEMINFLGKDITVGSLFLTTADSSYIETTIIDGQTDDSYLVTFENYETRAAVLTGFQIGLNTLDTSGILCENAEPQILNNNISVDGIQGIWCKGPYSPLIADNFINDTSRCIQLGDHSQAQIINNHLNVVQNPAARGIYVSDALPIIESNIITGDAVVLSVGIHVTADALGAYIFGNRISGVDCGIEIHGLSAGCEVVNNIVHDCGRGIWMDRNDCLSLNNTVVNNTSYGFACEHYFSQRIINCISWGNHPNINFYAYASISNSCFEAGLPQEEVDFGGNISRYPRFLDEESHDYRLSPFSPCIDAGIADTTGLNIPLYDLAGNVRSQDGIGDGVIITDMGCYEADTVTDPAYISGNVALSGGAGNIEEVCVGVGAPVHPDAQGNYLITTPAGNGLCPVTAWLPDYLPQTISDVTVIPGQTTTNIDFNLEYYQPEAYLEFSPDTLFFLTYDDIFQDITIKNISLLDLYITNIGFTTYHFNFDISFPQFMAPGDSIQYEIWMEVPLPSDLRVLHYDSMIIFTDIGQFNVPLIWEGNLVDSILDNSIPSTELKLTNYPNPFNPNTVFSFTLPEPGYVKLEVFNLKGQKVKTLFDEWTEVLDLNIAWNGDDQSGKPVASGIYFGRLSCQENSFLRKCLLLK